MLAVRSTPTFVLHCPQASKGKPAVIRQLLAAKAAVNATDSTGSTPLHRAASAGGRWVCWVPAERQNNKPETVSLRIARLPVVVVCLLRGGLPEG